jgi:hypothetical protein
MNAGKVSSRGHPDVSPEAIAHRRKAVDRARAANIRAGYTYDPVLEEATEAFVAGELTIDELRERVLQRFQPMQPPGVRG